MGIWDDINKGIADTGIIQAVNPFIRDVVPGVAAVEDILGMDPNSWNPAAGPGTVLDIPQPTRGGRIISGGGGELLGGASGSWTGGGMNFDLTTTGMRGLVPFQGQGPPAPGYHLARRQARRPQQGRAAGMYWVPRRTMNPLNPRALLRAERRMSSFTHWVKRHFTIQHAMPRRKKSRGRFTRKKR